MKRKIIIGLGIFSLLSVMSGLYLIMNIESATSTLNNLIKLHQVEIVREHLLIQIRRVQADLYLKNTRHAKSIDTVMGNVKNMTEVSNVCFQCHHDETVTKKLLGLKKHIEDYKDSISRVITMRAESARLQEEEDAAFHTGEDLVAEVNDMIKFSNMRLHEKTETALKRIARTKLIIFSLVGLGPLFAVVFAVIFLRGFTRPVNAILDATRILKSGDLNYRIEGLKDEFGEVGSSFNEMAMSLNEQMHKMQRAEQMTLVGEMAASIAHEIKNPLTGIKIALQMLSENKVLSKTESEIVSASFSQIKRVESLIREVLDFARPKEPEYSLANINTLIEKTVSFIEAVSTQSRKNIDVKVLRALATDIPDVMIDPMQLQQAVMNIVLNAYDAMPRGGTLTITTAHYDGSCAMTVADTGSGIDEKNLQKLFKPFHTTKQKGTGLGLPITKGIVERHGGTIKVDSKIGEGTTVTILLPLNRGMGAGPETP